MKKKNRVIGFLLVAILVVGLLAGCGGAASTEDTSAPKTVTYQSEKGPIQVPANPKRVAVLASSYTGNVLSLGITPVSADQWAKNSKFLGDKLKNVETVTPDSLEKILALKPDLIIALSNDKNLKKYQDIAPTVAFTYEKY